MLLAARRCAQTRAAFPHAPQPDHRHGFESFSAATNSGACAALETGSGRVHGRGIHQRILAVRRAADVHAHGSAAPRRLSIGLVGGHGVLPDHAVRRLRLRAYPDAGGAAAGRRRRPRRAAYHSRADAAFVNRRKLGRSAGPRDGVLAHRLVFGLDRAAFLRARRQQSAAAGLVRAQRAPRHQGPLFSLRGLECRQLPRLALLPFRPRADIVAAPAQSVVERRLLAVVCVDRGVRLSAAAFSGARRDGGANGAALAGAGLACARPLGVPGGGSLRALGRGDRLHIHRHRGGAASLGHSAVALPVDLGAGLPTASAVAASLGADGAALRDCGHCRADGLWQHRLSAARAGRAPHRLLRDRSGQPR